MKSYSQAGQDEWVHSIVGDSGYFVDVGAHDGVVHSNTYALEQIGWTGIGIEPNRGAFGQLTRNRSCALSCTAASSYTGALLFDGVRVGAGDQIACATLVDLLDLTSAPPVIDFLSIDTEGHELEVLAGMDFDRWHVRLATIEHNLYCDGPARKEAIADVMFGHGFERVREDVVAPGYGEYEDWWVHRDG